MNFYFASIGRLALDFKDHIDTNHAPHITCDVFDSPSDLKSTIHKYNALAAFRLPPDLSIENIKWIHSFGAGVDDLIEDLTTSQILTKTTGMMGQRMAEYCLAYILSHLKGLNSTARNQSLKSWSPITLRDLYKQRVLVFGTGYVGSAVGKVLRSLCKNVAGVNRSGQPHETFHNTLTHKKLPDELPFDVIVNTMPLTKATQGYFDQNFFERCDRTLFINVGRGASVVEQALIDAVDSSNLIGAVLDVFEKEPLPYDSPLWEHPAITITPHHASKTTVEDMQQSFDEIVKSMKSGTETDLMVDITRGY